MTIKLDTTRHRTVVTCDKCPWWYGFADSKGEGRRVGARHEQRAHPDEDQARRMLDEADRRAAARA